MGYRVQENLPQDHIIVFQTLRLVIVLYELNTSAYICTGVPRSTHMVGWQLGINMPTIRIVLQVYEVSSGFHLAYEVHSFGYPPNDG